MFSGGKKRTCRRIHGVLSEYMDNRLSDNERAVVERHLEECAACSKELESLRMTVGLLDQLPSVSVPRSFTLREADVLEQRKPEPERPGRMRPVPVLAAGRADTGWLSIFDPQRLRWLRPVAAFATAALVLLLMLDFLQVIPHEGGLVLQSEYNASESQAVLSSTPDGDIEKYSGGGVQPPEMPPAPAPTDDITFGGEGLGLKDTAGSEEQALRALEGGGITNEAEGGWPLRQIEIALGSVLFALVATMLVAWRRRRKLLRT